MSGAYLTTEDGTSQILAFDLTISETHGATSEVTKHPVENGSDIADHIRTDPQTCSLVVFVTNTPIVQDSIMALSITQLDIPKYEPPIEATPGSLFRVAEGALGALADAITGGPKPTTATVLSANAPFDRITDTYTQLLVWWAAKQTLTVTTSIRTYPEMAITSVSVPITDAGGAEFTLAFEQIATVTSSTVDAPKPLEPRGAPAVNKGAQAPKPPDATAKAVAQSFLAKGLDLIAGTSS